MNQYTIGRPELMFLGIISTCVAVALIVQYVDNTFNSLLAHINEGSDSVETEDILLKPNPIELINEVFH